MKELDHCPICNSKNIVAAKEVGLAPQVIHEVMPGVEVYAAVISRYYKCMDCNLIFQNPRMSDAELEKYYGGGYYQRSLNISEEKKDKDERYRAGIDAGIIKKYIDNIISHLDVGCSRGYLLEAVWAKTKVGVDTYVGWEMLKEIKVYKNLDKVPHKSFDLVTAIHVLEHVPDPFGFLKKMARFVKKDGFLVIEVPTWKSPGGPLRLAHLFHFEPDVLKLLCMRAGLKVEAAEFTPHLLLICKKADD